MILEKGALQCTEAGITGTRTRTTDHQRPQNHSRSKGQELWPTLVEQN